MSNAKQEYAARYQSARASAMAQAPFIGPGDVRYDSFMGIANGSVGSIGASALSRIEIYKRAVWVYACTEARDVPLSRVPLKLYQKTPDNHHNEVREHPVLDLMLDVNPTWDTASSIRYNTEQSLCIHGRYHWLKVRNPAGVVRELYGLPVQFTQVLPSQRPGQYVDVFRYQPQGSGSRRDYGPGDVVYFRYATPEQDVQGLPPLQVAIETTAADIAIQVAQNAMSVNAARPSAVITVKQKWSEADYKRVTEELNRKYAGAVNAGKIMLIDNADNTTFQKVQLTPAEMEWIKSHESHAQDICVAFRVPPMIANDFGDASRLANAGAGHRFYWENTLIPELQSWEDVLNWQLLYTEDWGRGGRKDSNGNWYSYERWNGFYLKHDLSGIQALREDENARATRARNSIGLGVSVNESRQMLGYDPLEDEKMGSTIFVMNNLVPLDIALTGANNQPDVVAGESGGDKTTEQQLNQRGNKSGASSLKTDLADKNNLTRTEDQKAGVRAELRRWRDVARKDLTRALQFQSDLIPAELQNQIRSELALTGTSDFEVKKKN